MNHWIISDTHFGHTDKMIEYCNRPEDYEATLWAELYEIPEGDTLIHLGDFCIGQDKRHHEFLKGLKCRKILVKGNHDHKSTSWYLSNGWDFVCDRFSWKLHKKHIIFSHEPVKLPDNDYTINIHGHLHNAMERILRHKWVVEGEEERNRETLEVLSKNHTLIACELTNYKPILLDKIIHEGFQNSENNAVKAKAAIQQRQMA